MKKILLASSLALVSAVSAVAADASGWDYNRVFPKVGYERTEKGFEISVWGRTYRYADSIFPASVKTAGREIFAAPMKLHASFGGGMEGVFHDWKYTLVKRDDECVQIAASAHCSNVIVNAGITSSATASRRPRSSSSRTAVRASSRPTTTCPTSPGCGSRPS